MEYKRKGKKALKVFLIVVSVLLGLIALSHTAITIKAFANYRYNVKVFEEYNHSGIINNQWDLQKMAYGFGNIGANGCGAVSVYNILEMEERNPDFPKIIKQFDLCGENVFGIGGSKPSRVIGLLKKYGFKVRFSLDENDFEEIAQNSKYAIFVYFGINNFVPFGHYQLLFNFDGERFDTINTTGNYTLDEITNVNHTMLKIMIGIDT